MPLTVDRLVYGVDLVHGDAVVEALLLLVAKVPQAIPLRRGLRVEGLDVIVDEAWVLAEEVVVEGAAGEEGGRLGRHGRVEGDPKWGRGGGGVQCELVDQERDVKM